MDISLIKTYLESLPEEIFPQKFLRHAAVFLSGSIGWGIKDISDKNADLDIHILLSESDYKDFLKQFEPYHIIDDQKHQPNVFGQVRPISGLEYRLTSNDRKWWPLYLWIYTHGQWVIKLEETTQLVNKAELRFNKELETLLKDHFVTYCVKKCDMKSCIRQGEELAAKCYMSDTIIAALQTYSLSKGIPYPYHKWLKKHISTLEGGEDFITLCEKSMVVVDTTIQLKSLNEIEKILIDAITKTIGRKPWLNKWWKFNEN
ncbi:MAG: hypothetical protein PHX21_04575 [bacterium]|nr:hypothetical protein [bacterium]